MTLVADGNNNLVAQALTDYSDNLSSIVEEPEQVWLFKILTLPTPTLNNLLPIVQWMEEHGIIAKRPTDREALLSKLGRMVAKTVPYSSADQISGLLNRIKVRHEKRIGAAMESGDLNGLQGVMDSFFIINKLAVLTVSRGFQNVEYLRVVRSNLEAIFVGERPLLGKSLSSGDDAVLHSLATTKMLAHVKEVFDDTFVQTISLLREKLPGADPVGELIVVSAGYMEVMPELALDVHSILKSVNLLIVNVNTTVHPARPYPLFPVPSG